jgi:PRTRC genetic system protein A
MALSVAITLSPFHHAGKMPSGLPECETFSTAYFCAVEWIQERGGDDLVPRSCHNDEVFLGSLGFTRHWLNASQISRRLFERLVGFLARIGDRYGAEAAALLVWNERSHRIEAIVPEQCSRIGLTRSGWAFPIELEYTVPLLSPQLLLIGDIHSHVDLPAYASATDKADELHRPGLHIVVGRLSQEPPDLHIEVTIDGTRFEVRDPAMVLAGYERRRLHEVPQQWLDQVHVEIEPGNDQPSGCVLPEDNGPAGPGNSWNDVGVPESRGTEDTL